MTAPASAAEGANWLDNGDFEWVIDCDSWVGWKDGSSADDPEIVASGGNPCAHLSMEVDGELTNALLVVQEVAVNASVGQWIVLRFDAMASDDGFGAAKLNANAISTGYQGLPSSCGWVAYTLAVQLTTGNADPAVTASFRLCRGNDSASLKIDNVAVTVENSDPGPDTLEEQLCAFPTATTSDLATAGSCCEGDCAVGANDTRPDTVVDFADVLALLSDWDQTCSRCNTDGSGLVGFADLEIVLADWGKCPGSSESEPPSVASTLSCMDIDSECWDDMLELLETGTNLQQSNMICWINHYWNCHCLETCVGAPEGCGDDPCGQH